jgi:hypothetical protein
VVYRSVSKNRSEFSLTSFEPVKVTESGFMDDEAIMMMMMEIMMAHVPL